MFLNLSAATPPTPSPLSPSQVRGNALLLIITLGVGGSFHLGYHNTALSSPSPVWNLTFISNFHFSFSP